ncbi:MAG: 1-acyl-sn-glycerol-3-phosphate acyltransferase [Lachnospiraceae bacterium]|nr:1-acyl-sn-glycerol-3-phosphate acyltransferase [Lachnospiraceae bacterium]
MRSIIVALTMFLWLVLTFPVYLIVALVGVFNKRACASFSQKFVNSAFRVLMWEVGAKTTVIGRELVPKDRPVLYVSNHRSYADTPLGYINVVGTTGFIAKKEIKKFPILSLWMKNMTCLFLDRDDMRQGLKTILTAIDNVKDGYSVFIMPEGTRNHNEEMLPFKEGSFKVAEKSGCPIIPVAFSNTDALYELHKPWIKKAKVVVHFGEPVYLDNISREEKKALAGKIQGIIADMLKEDKKLIG